MTDTARREPDSVRAAYLAEYAFTSPNLDNICDITLVTTDVGQPDGWLVPLPTVLALLTAVGDGTVPAEVAHQELLSMSRSVPRIGCCMTCTLNVERYERVWADYQTAQIAYAANQQGMTPATHPYGVTKARGIHTWDCRAVPAGSIEPPGRLEDFTHGGIGWTFAGAQRLTAAEARKWMLQGSYRRCKQCQPALPGAYESESSDVA